MEMIARYRNIEPKTQSLTDHLLGVANLAVAYAKDLGFADLIELAALLHDAGKATVAWQKYLNDSVEGKISHKKDHATAGAQLIEENFGGQSILAKTAIQASIMFHHGMGLPDMICLNGESEFLKRLRKSDVNQDIIEINENLGEEINQRIQQCLTSKTWQNDGRKVLLDYLKKTSKNKKQLLFNMGLHLRNFSSCLIDADRTDSATFENGEILTSDTSIPNWKDMLLKLEKQLNSFSNNDKLGKIRTNVSNKCKEIGQGDKGIFTCSAFTGAGKTLASLRFALEQAHKHKMKRIIIIAPYTSIIDQNADVIRNILEDDDTHGKIVLECHSNITAKRKTELLNSETEYDKYEQVWSTPVIITTMVQFLETLYASGTKNIRRMHNLTNSVLIFDEIQTLPIKASYLFNWGLEYLVNICGCSALLCTATQPCLHTIGKGKQEQFNLEITGELIENIENHFDSLKRVNFLDKTNGGREDVSQQEVCNYIQTEMQTCKSFLAVVNTKSQAKELYNFVTESCCADFVYHLSTDMCPMHRREKIAEIKEHLKNGSRIVCVTTRLIEAGVDVSFQGALRFIAGLDSIIQTAGRCNRNNELVDSNGSKMCGTVAIFSIQDEKISSLKELQIGQDCMKRILREFKKQDGFIELINPEIITCFFTYYYAQFSESAKEYSLQNKDTTVIDLLSDNELAVSEYKRVNKGKAWELPYMQSFRTAWENFEVISNSTTGIIVPYKNDIAGRLCALERYDEGYSQTLRKIMREAQQYSVNVYSNQLERLKRKNMIYEVIPDSGIYALYEDFYTKNLGLVCEILN